MRLGSLSLALCLLAACSSSSPSGAPVTGAPGTRVLADYTLAGGFYAAPFPDDTRLSADGHPDLSGFPNTTNTILVDESIALIQRDYSGFSTTAGIFFALDGPLDAGVEEDPAASLAKGATVFLIDVDDGTREPVTVHFDADGGAFGAPNLLSLIPLQGIPLHAKARYAAVVLRSAKDAAGKRLGVPDSLAQLVAGQTPKGMSAAVAKQHRDAIAALKQRGVDPAELAGLAVFTTDDPTAGMGKVVSAMLARPLPAPVQPFQANEVFDDYCVFSSTIEMPVYQSGTPPYANTGGDWLFDDKGEPIYQGDQNAHIVVTVPRRKMPAAGFPIVLFSRTGGGGDRPLVDRGVQPGTGQPPITPGTGPAMDFAQVGWAGASVDGPQGGLRNVTGGDEQFLMFNVNNPAALRDNVRQSAAELALQAHVLEELTLDASSCPGLDTGGAKVHFDTGHLVLMGHSMGATISPLSLAVEPMFQGTILSGEGGSWIENILYKQHPVNVAPLAALLLGIPGTPLTEQNPALSLFQWAAESADPPVYAPYIVHAPRSGKPKNVLMVQGIVDHYIMPTISQASSLSLGLDFAGDAVDDKTPEIAAFPTLDAQLQFSGRSHITLPASGNIDAHTTAVVVQQKEDGIEDGHEVVFQTEPPKHMYRCFLASLLAGTPTVPPPGAEQAACP